MIGKAARIQFGITQRDEKVPLIIRNGVTPRLVPQTECQTVAVLIFETNRPGPDAFITTGQQQPVCTDITTSGTLIQQINDTT